MELGALMTRLKLAHGVPMQERIVAIGLLTKHDLSLLGPTFDRIWPVEEAPNFSEMLRAIDEADRALGEGSTDSSEH